MNELPTFIAYRDTDGAALALWVYHELRGRSLLLRRSSTTFPVLLSPYFDRAAPAVDDWRKLHERELHRARALVLICTPGAAVELTDGRDWLYYELRWWLENRRKVAPILVVSTETTLRFLPKLIRDQWPQSHVVKIEPELYNKSAHRASPELTESKRKACVQSILGGIAHSAGDEVIRAEPGPWSAVGMMNMPGLYTWEKDRRYRYINANENYARAAGFDSPGAMIGKSDEEMPWRSLVSLFRAGDEQVMSGYPHSRIAVQEKEIMVDRVADILVNESALRDRRGEVVGLTGSFFEITGRDLVWRTEECETNTRGFHLGEGFGQVYITAAEAKVFRCLVQNKQPNAIAVELRLTPSQVGAQLFSLKRKLQASTVGDIVATAVRAGLPLRLFGPMISEPL